MMFKSPMWITPVTPAAHRFGERFTWLTSQWKLRADPAQFWVEINILGFGYYPRSGFMHIDLGPARSWGDPFPARAVPFAPELPPAREVLSDSRTLRGGGAAGAATIGAAGVEVLQDVLAETQSTIQPLVPYLDTLRWVLIAIALIGIAVTIYARIDDWKRGQR